MVIGATIAATPTISIVLKMFEPTTLPTARSAVPFSAETRLTQNSGADVPSATMVSPITICGICIRSASATAPSVRRSAPQRTSTTPAIIIRMFTIISCNLLIIFYFRYAGFQRRDSVPHCLCLTASYSRMAALTDTFSESATPSIGMRMWAVAARRHWSVRPVASVPITIAVGRRISVS